MWEDTGLRFSYALWDEWCRMKMRCHVNREGLLTFICQSMVQPVYVVIFLMGRCEFLVWYIRYIYVFIDLLLCLFTACLNLTWIFLSETRILDKLCFVLVNLFFYIYSYYYNILTCLDLLPGILRVVLSSYHRTVKLFVAHIVFLWFQTVTMLQLLYFRNSMEIMEKMLVHPHTNVTDFLKE